MPARNDRVVARFAEAVGDLAADPSAVNVLRYLRASEELEAVRSRAKGMSPTPTFARRARTVAGLASEATTSPR